MIIEHTGDKIIFKLNEVELDDLEQAVVKYENKGLNREDALYRALYELPSL